MLKIARASHGYECVSFATFLLVKIRDFFCLKFRLLTLKKTIVYVLTIRIDFLLKVEFQKKNSKWFELDRPSSTRFF